MGGSDSTPIASRYALFRYLPGGILSAQLTGYSEVLLRASSQVYTHLNALYTLRHISRTTAASAGEIFTAAGCLLLLYGHEPLRIPFLVRMICFYYFI